jgi:chorismate mutase
MRLLKDTILIESNEFNPEKCIAFITQTINLNQLHLNKFFNCLIDYEHLEHIDLNQFKNSNVFISNLSFSNANCIDTLKQKGNHIHIVSKMDSTENFMKSLEFCNRNGVELIIDVSEYTDVNWDSYIMESEHLGIMYNNNFSHTSANNKLKALRDKIEECDKIIYEQFALRMRLIEEIAKQKKIDNSEVYQPAKFIENIISLINNKNIERIKIK